MLTIYPITTLALVLALIVYFALSVNVGRARATWNVPAPQASGHPEFDKRYRVQMNTLEQLALFVPGVIVGAPVLGDLGKFPPVQFHCGGNEVLIGDATDFVTKMALAGGLVEAHFVPGAGHGWTFTQPQSAGAKYTMSQILRYLRDVPTTTA